MVLLIPGSLYYFLDEIFDIILLIVPTTFRMNPFDRDQELGEFHGCEISIKLLIVLCKYPSLARGLFLQDSIKITITNHC